MYIFSPSTIIRSAEVNSNFTEALGFAGEIKAYGGAAAPTGWLICDGSEISRVTYAALFNAIGTAYGAGNNTTTFNIPDFRNRVIVGKGTDSIFNALGNTGGANTVSIQHSHTIAHIHSIYIAGFQSTFSNVGGNERQPNNDYTLGHYGWDDNTEHDWTRETGGSSNASSGTMSANATPSIVQKFGVANFIIKT